MKLMLRQERISRGWTQQYVAEKVGITKSAILLLETGKTKPSYEVLVKLENLFQMPHRKLLAPISSKK